MNWKGIYKNKGIVLERPSRHVIEFARLLSQSENKRVYDHGCGTGRHLVYLADQGFDVFGSDHSSDAVKICKKLLSCQYKDHISISDMSVIPYPDEHFSGVISSQVIQHALKPQRDKSISELIRVLSPGGYLLLRTISQRQYGYELGVKLEKDTYVNIPGLPDGSSPHHYFTKKELEKYFENLNILKLDEVSNPPLNGLWTNGLEELVLVAKK
jgi:SAM-dependent methyltransferase